MVMTCILTQLQFHAASRPHGDKFLMINSKPKYYSTIPVLNNNTPFTSCSISSYNSSNNLLADRSIFTRFHPIRNVFDDIRNNLQPMQILISRMLASSALLFAVMTMALFCTRVPPSAASYGIMGGGSDGSSEDDDSSDYYYIYNDNDCSNCNRRTRVEKSCTICDCNKEKNEDKPKSCTECSCYEEKNEVSSSSCNCDCHRPCDCTCHVPVETIATLLFIIFCIAAVFYVIVEEVDNRWGSVIMVQVAILDKKRVLQRELNRIAGTANTETKSGLNCLLEEVVRSLYEHHDQCHFAYLYAMYNHLEKSSRPSFRGILEMEVGKFDKNDETFVNVDGVRYRKESARKFKSIDNEYSVVTLLVLVHGKYLIPSLMGNTTHVKKAEVKNALQTIHSIPRSNLEAVKVLWTPQTENDVVSEQEVRRDFGLLMRPVDLTE